MTRLNWERANLVTKPNLSLKSECELTEKDRAARWLARVEERLAKNNQLKVRDRKKRHEK